jgi:hypothetical protein
MAKLAGSGNQAAADPCRRDIASLRALAASARGDRARARRIVAAVHDAAAPDGLRALAEALDALATSAGAAELVRSSIRAR